MRNSFEFILFAGYICIYEDVLTSHVTINKEIIAESAVKKDVKIEMSEWMKKIKAEWKSLMSLNEAVTTLKTLQYFLMQ